MGSFDIAAHVDNILSTGRLAYVIPDYYLTIYGSEGELPRIDIISKEQGHVPHYLLYVASGIVHSISSSQGTPGRGVSVDSQQAIRGVIQSATLAEVGNLLLADQSIGRPPHIGRLRSFVTRGHCFDDIRNLLEYRAATVLDWEVAHNAFDLYACALVDQGMDASGLTDSARMAKQAADRHSRQFDSLAAGAAAQGYRVLPPIDDYRSTIMEFFFAK